MEGESPLNSALRQFEAVEANLVKLERLWSEEIRPSISTGVAFHGDTPEYDRSCRQFKLLITALPDIDGWKPDSLPMELNAIGQNRLDALEIGEIDAQVAVEDAIDEPIRQLRDYRFRFDEKRRELIRDSLVERIDLIDARLRILGQALQPTQGGSTDVSGLEWEGLKDDVAQIHSLLGSSVARPPRWSDLHRHLRFAMAADLYDIINHDWPAAKAGLRKSLYGEKEPVPVDVRDLGLLVATKPKGAVVTKLQWDQLTEEDFERLIYALISSEEGYVNPQWLTKTNATDRGRDLSVVRVHVDPLSGTTTRELSFSASIGSVGVLHRTMFQLSRRK